MAKRAPDTEKTPPPKIVIEGQLTVVHDPANTIITRVEVAPNGTNSFSISMWDENKNPIQNTSSIPPGWSITGGSSFSVETGPGTTLFKVPLDSGATAKSSISPTAHGIEVRCTLPRVTAGPIAGGDSLQLVIKLFPGRQEPEKAFLECCKNYAIEPSGAEGKISPLNAFLAHVNESVAADNTALTMRAWIGLNTIRWVYKGLSPGGNRSRNARLYDQNGHVAFRLGPDDEWLLDTGSRTYSLVATARWGSNDHDDAPEVCIELAWKQEAWLTQSPQGGLASILSAAIARGRESRRSLLSIAGGQAESFFPDVHSIASSDREPAVLLFKQRCRMTDDGMIELPAVAPWSRAVVSALSSFDGELTSRHSSAVTAQFSLGGIGSVLPFAVELDHDPNCLETEASTGDVIASFRLRPGGAEKSAPWFTRLGSLSLTAHDPGGLAEEPPDGSSMSRLVITRPRRPSQAGSSSGPPEVGIEWHLRLGVDRITPEGVDRPWGDREDRRLPLVVPRIRESAVGQRNQKEPPAPKGDTAGPNGGTSQQQQKPFVLVVDESVGPGRDRWLRATVLENSNDQGSDQEISTLLSFQPWSVLRFTRRRLERLGDAENAVVAVFDGDQRTWRVKQAVPEYAYEFPPQGIGESADKPGMLEIHDLSEATREWFEEDVIRNPGDTNVIVVRPAPTKSPSGSQLSANGIERSFLIETRLTPSLDLWVKPSDLDRTYILPEWQAHEILRRRNDFGLGVALRALRGEFLYGLSVGVDASRETGPSAMARVAEIEALTGKLPPLVLNPSPSTMQSPLVRRWRALRRALLSRSERIELWTPSYDQIRPFAHARFENGATFAFRTTALLRPPLPDPAAASPAVVRPGSPRFGCHGLPGGAIWPLESSGVLEQLVRTPAATGGTIERITISPGGGDADQAVEFADGYVTIASQTRAGFLQRQKIEVLGRIGVFWHRAKHVIVYERTVNPSEQFAPVADNARWHKTRSRRAILRKVSEYIEILQPTRAYPDLGPKTGTECGFLDSVRFNTRIIHVDGSWKTEWAAEPTPSKKPAGYKIPLWNAGAAEQRPNVYPLPSVSVVTLGEGKEKRPLVPRQIANPENLYFFTQTASGGASTPGPCDPDSWEPFFGVDYGNLADPADLERLIAPGGDRYGGAGNQSDGTFAPGRKPSTPRVLPGHHRFTWRLLPDGKRTTLNAGVDGAPVYGDLDSITFSRGTVDNGDALAAEAVVQLQAAAADPPTVFLRALDALSAKLADNAAITQSDIKEQAQTHAQHLVDTLQDLRNICDRTTSVFESPLNREKLTSLLDDTLLKKRRLIKAILRDWAVTASRWSDEEINDLAKTHGNDAKHIVAELLGVRQMVDGLLDDVQTGIGSIRADIAAIRRAVTDCIAALRSQLARTTARFEAALDAAERDVAATGDWSAGIYAETRTLVIAEINTLADEIKAEADETLRRISVESTPLATPIVNGLKTALAAFVSDQEGRLEKCVANNLPERLPTTRFSPKEKLAVCRTGIDSLIGEIDKLGSKLLKQLDTPDEVLNSADTNLFEPIQKCREAASEFLTDTGFVKKICDGLPDTRTASGFREHVSAKLHKLAETISPDGQQPDWLVEVVTNGKENTGELNTITNDACDKAAKWANGIVPNGDDLKALRDALLPDSVDKAISAIAGAGDNIEQIRTAVKNAKTSFDEWKRTIKASEDVAVAYKVRVSEALANIDRGGVRPGNVLSLVSAATQAPEIGQMQANIDRMRCSYTKAKIETSKAMASLSKLGSALKALGIEMPFDGLGDQLELDANAFEAFQKKFDLHRLLPDFGGIKLDGLLEGAKLPETSAEFREAVKLRHGFDKVHLRAWAQVDVNMPIKGRKKLFGIGPMTMYFRESLLTGSMRAEASKESADASTTGSGLIETNIDVDVGGELLLSLEKVRIEYSKEKKLHVDFDPARIRLHSAMQFVQDTFGDLLGDEIGGLTIVKEKGVPVGLEHQFTLPVMSLMAGTSGISNIQLSNAFRLMAYPDFVISNRFCLSRPELPFLFTFFIVGGTGYVIVDSRYRPLDRALTVEVEAAIGGAAALGIATGAISGQVFITFSVALAYRKSFTGGAATGDGLSVAVVLLVAGNVNIAGIVDVYIGVMLRLTYREGGAIYGVGTVNVTVKISVFFTFKFRSEMTLKMRGGRAETTRKISTSGEPGKAVDELTKKVDDYKHKAEQLAKTRA